MKQIERVSIGGYVFTLDPEAAAETDSYLKEISAYYSNPEISEGIEERMAELLRERTTEAGVVGKSTILSIIDILGRPERIAQDEPEGAGPDRQPSDKPVRKLYRDMQNARVAGVCSGLGSYFNIDPAIPRIIFVALTVFGMVSPWSWGNWHLHLKEVVVSICPLIYIILWICMPAARTVQQRWEMRGDDGSAESVRRNIESGTPGVSGALRQVGNSPAWGTIGRVIEVGIGLILIVTAVSGLFAGGLAIFGWKWLGLSELIREGMAELTNEIPQAASIAAAPWVQILALAAYGLPFLGMLYGGIMLLFRIKSPSWRPGLVIFVLWLMVVIALFILAAAATFSGATSV